jgi:hypothetical protein
LAHREIHFPLLGLFRAGDQHLKLLAGIRVLRGLDVVGGGCRRRLSEGRARTKKGR